MSNRKVIENYYNDINELTDILGKLTNSYRLLIGGANELNGIALATKGNVKAALKRVDRLGDIIDEVIRTIDETNEDYIAYCKLKSTLFSNEITPDFIQGEIEEELKR